MQLIDIVCIFIRAERIRDCHLHLSTLQEMPIFCVKRNDSALSSFVFTEGLYNYFPYFLSDTDFSLFL